MRRSPDVFAEWNEAAFADDFPSRDDRRLAWLWLYRRCFVDGQWRVPLDEALLVAEMGMSLRLGQRRYAEAAAIGRRFFEHPQISLLDPADRCEASFWLALALLCAGDYAAGTVELQRIVDFDGWGDRPRRRLAAGAIIGFAERTGLGREVPAPIRAFAQELLYDWPSFRRRALDSDAAETMGELCLVLEDVRSR